MSAPFPPTADPTSAASYSPPPAPPAPRSRLPLILGAAAAAVVLLAAAVTGAVLLFGGSGLDRETAQRECRTALEREADQRASNPGGASDTGVLVSLAGVELEETWETDNGWSVNGKANYTLTTPLLGKNSHAVSLTCEATAGDGGEVRTTVKNRS